MKRTGKIKKAVRYLTDPDYRWKFSALKGEQDHLSDEDYLRRMYKARVGKKLNLEHPQTFNEKLQWLKLNDRNPIYTTMVDKYAAKKYVADIIGEEYIIPTYGVWNHFDEIDFDQLPDQFVLKCTHDSGGLVIVNDKAKMDKTAAKKILESSIKLNYYYYSREWPYKDVPPRIIAEKYMEDTETGELRDYKFYCFNGELKIILVCQDRFGSTGLTEDFYTPEWEHLNIKRPDIPNAMNAISRPALLDEMMRFSRVLSHDISFLRTDFYVINNQIYFGELTLYPASGFAPFEPEEWDYKIGSWLKLLER